LSLISGRSTWQQALWWRRLMPDALATEATADRRPAWGEQADAVRAAAAEVDAPWVC
jgi:hypothetical protein